MGRPPQTLAAGKVERAVQLVERERWAALDADRGYVLARWLSLLPESATRRRPVLMLASAWTLFFKLSYEALPRHRRAAANAKAGLTLTREALGRPSAAGAALDLLRDYARVHADPESQVIAESCRQRLTLLRGGTGPGIRRPAASPEPMIFWLEIPAVTRCRALLAAGSDASLEEAVLDLERCLELNRGHHNVRQEIEIRRSLGGGLPGQPAGLHVRRARRRHRLRPASSSQPVS